MQKELALENKIFITATHYSDHWSIVMENR